MPNARRSRRPATPGRVVGPYTVRSKCEKGRIPDAGVEVSCEWRACGRADPRGRRRKTRRAATGTPLAARQRISGARRPAPCGPVGRSVPPRPRGGVKRRAPATSRSSAGSCRTRQPSYRSLQGLAPSKRIVAPPAGSVRPGRDCFGSPLPGSPLSARWSAARRFARSARPGLGSAGRGWPAAGSTTATTGPATRSPAGSPRCATWTSRLIMESSSRSSERAAPARARS